MADKPVEEKRLSKTDQRKSIEAFFKGQKLPVPTYGVSNEMAHAGGGRNIPSTDSMPSGPELHEAEQTAEVSAMQARNEQNPAMAGKMAAANDAIRRYNEKMAADLQKVTPPAPSMMQEPTVGQEYPTMEGDAEMAIKQALLKKLQGGM